MHVFVLSCRFICMFSCKVVGFICVFRFILKISNLQLTNQNAGFVTESAIYTRYAQLPIKTSGENRQMKQLGIFAAVTIE